MIMNNNKKINTINTMNNNSINYFINTINDIFSTDEYLKNSSMYYNELSDDKHLEITCNNLSKNRCIKEYINEYFNTDNLITNEENIIEILQIYKYYINCPQKNLYEDDYLLYYNTVQPTVFNKIIKYIIKVINNEKKNGEIYDNIEFSYEKETQYFISKLNDIYSQNEYLKKITYLSPDFMSNSFEQQTLDMHVMRHIVNIPRIKNYINNYLKNEQEFIESHIYNLAFPHLDQAYYFSPNYIILKKRIFRYIMESIKKYISV